MNPLLRPLALCWRYWPQLVACYLVGVLGRRGAIELAAWLGYDNDWWAALIMPLAAMARLGSYVAMFLVLRRGIPALAGLPRRSARRIDVFATIIVPFFAVYLAWQLFKEDWLEFEARALYYRVGQAMTSAAGVELHPESLTTTTTTWVLVGGALVLRLLLAWLKDRLPGWLIAVRVYVDALWVFLVLTFSVKEGLTFLVNPGEWLSERRIIVWFNTTRADLFSSFRPLEIAWDATVSAVHTVFGGAVIPLLWLAIAGIVYGAGIGGWRGAVRRTAGHRATELFDKAAPAGQRVHRRWSRVPRKVRDKAHEFVRSQLGRFEPIVDSARVIMHGGILALSLYVLGYLVLAWLDLSGSFYGLQFGPGYLFRGIAWALGPHPLAFWSGYADSLALLSHMIVDPLRICLIASTFAYCVEHAVKLQREAKPDASLAVDDVDGGGHGVVGQQETELQPTRIAAQERGAVGRRDGELADPLRPPPVRPVGGITDAIAETRGSQPVDRDNQ